MVRAEASRAIRQIYKLSASAAKDQLSILRASRSNLQVRVRALGKRIPLLEFTTGAVSLAGVRFRASRGKLRVARSAGRKPPPVSVQVKVQGGRKAIKGAFLAVMPSGHVGVFSRGKYGGGGFVQGRPRLPITGLTTLSVPRAFSNKTVMKALRTIAVETFTRNFQHELQFRTSR